MGTYTPEKFIIPSGLDEIGLHLGLQRFEDESQSSYRRRLLLEARDPSGPTEAMFIRSLGRRVGVFDVPVFEIDLILDVNDEPLAPAPYIEVTSTHLRAYSDHDNDVLDFELNLVDRNDAYFLREVDTAFTASTYFDHTILDTTYTYKRSNQLRYSDTNEFNRTFFFRESRSNRLNHKYIREIYPQALQHFQTEVFTLAEVDAEGKFYVDYTNGVVFTYAPASGILAYAYRQFPFTLWWQPVKSWPYNDADGDYVHKDTLIDDATGLTYQGLLNSDGARIANEILELHPLGWGE